MPETGSGGFEGLIQRLVSALIAVPIHLARSGDQAGRDMGAQVPGAPQIDIECKRYGPNTPLSRADLVDKIVAAAVERPELDGWILATTRDVSAQLLQALQRTGEHYQIEVSVIATDDGEPSTLEVLCASEPRIVVDHLRGFGLVEIDEVNQELVELAGAPRFTERIEQLRNQLSRTAAHEWCRHKTHEWLKQRFSSEDASWAAFQQVIDVDAPRSQAHFVVRRAADAVLDDWWRTWNDTHQRFVLRGGEGDGKTWTVAHWISHCLEAGPELPPVLWLSARMVLSQSPAEVIASALVQQCQGVSDKWLRRLERWVAGAPSSRLLLVIDGINEHHSPEWWLRLFSAFGESRWREHVAILVTARSGYCQYLSSLERLHFRESTLEPFDDEELEAALRGANVARGQLPSDVLTLARKPRYFDLVVRHHERLAEAGDVTVARLYYEDWQYRFQRKGLTLDAAQFQQMLKRLARQAIDEGIYAFSERQLSAVLPLHVDAAETVTELATGGILVEQDGQLRVDRQRLILGFGLLLADRVRDAATGRLAQLDETIAEFMGRHADADLEASIGESAVLHALRSRDFPQQGRVALLHAWVLMRNQRQDIDLTFPSYFPLAPQAYFSVAEHIWRDDVDEPWIERLMMRTLLTASRRATRLDSFVSAFERWLGFVHIGGPPGVGSADVREQRANTLMERVGRALAPGPFVYEDVPFTAVEDDGLMRLARVALGVISTLDRRPFARALVIAYVADALSATPDKYDPLKWVIRTADPDLTPDLLADVQALIGKGTVATLEAAYRILTAESSPQAIEIREQLPADLFPVHSFVAEHARDPCSSGLAWSREECYPCAEREDVNTYFLLKQIQTHSAALDFTCSDRIRARAEEFAATLEPATLHTGPYTSQADFHFEILEPTLCRCAPSTAAELVRAVVRTAATRSPLGVRQLLHLLSDHPLLLREDDYGFLRALFDSFGYVQSEAPDREPERIRRQLVALLLPGLTAPEQLTLLIQDPSSDVLLTCAPWIRTLSEEEQLKALVDAEAGDLHCLRRTMFFLAYQPGQHSRELAGRVTRYVVHGDSWIRGLALKIVLRAEDEVSGRIVVAGGWGWRSDTTPDEKHYGSLLLASHGGDLSYDELRGRIDPTLMGFALEKRGRRDELAFYVDDLDVLWTRVVQDAPIPDGELPALELRVGEASDMPAIERVGLSSREFARTIALHARHTSWGGDVDTASMTNASAVFGELSDEHFEERQQRMAEALTQQRNAGNIWYGYRFRSDVLPLIFADFPEKLERWLEPALNADHALHFRALELAHSFYQALCQVLLRNDPARGVELHRHLRDRASVWIREQFTGGLLIDRMLFSAEESVAVVGAWDERLNAASNDAELLSVAVMAQEGTAAEWLRLRVERDLSSERAFDVARGTMLCAFIQDKWAAEIVDKEPENEWVTEVIRRARTLRARDRDARHWFERFMHARDLDHAWAAFRLFLKCVDSRFGFWRDNLAQGADPDRLRYLFRSKDRVSKAIKENEKELTKAFLTHRVLSRQVWPWLEVVDAGMSFNAGRHRASEHG